jgi:hypothetical protein
MTSSAVRSSGRPWIDNGMPPSPIGTTLEPVLPSGRFIDAV